MNQVFYKMGQLNSFKKPAQIHDLIGKVEAGDTGAKFVSEYLYSQALQKNEQKLKIDDKIDINGSCLI